MRKSEQLQQFRALIYGVLLPVTPVIILATLTLLGFSGTASDQVEGETPLVQIAFGVFLSCVSVYALYILHKSKLTSKSYVWIGVLIGLTLIAAVASYTGF